jgi:mono/diheme cytochrome c family protein
MGDKSMKKVMLTLFILIILTLAACSGNETTESAATLSPVPADYAGLTNPLGADAAMAGADVFTNNCAACHGQQGHGDGPASTALDPAPKNLPELSTIVADDYLFWRISTGKPGTAMTAWKGVLTDEQIWQVVSFIRTLK